MRQISSEEAALRAVPKKKEKKKLFAVSLHEGAMHIGAGDTSAYVRACTLRVSLNTVHLDTGIYLLLPAILCQRHCTF